MPDALHRGWQFRAAPVLYILPDGVPLEPDYAVTWLEEDWLPGDVDSQAQAAMQVSLAAPKTEIQVGEEMTVIAAWQRLTGEVVMPLEPTIFRASGQQVEAADHQLIFSATVPGIYNIRTAQRYWLPQPTGVLDGSLEVRVVG